ncbi:MFS transporter [Asanoa siamensis]|uniref:MFS transporter n=1 Tax=Asanoa siamensis TaxID=926357 RepID=UPI001941489B|nr:MFS transporter [Asanoa siamensis]
MLGLGAGAQLVVGAYVQGLASVGPVLRDELGLSLSGVGVLLGCPTVGIVLCLIAWGRVCDRYGEENVIGFGLAGTAVFLAFAAAATSVAVVAATLVVAGATAAGVMVASGSAILAWFPPGQRGLAMGLRASGLPAGAAVAAATLPRVAQWGGLPAVFALLAVACLLTGTVVALGVRSPGAATTGGPRGAGRGVLTDRRLLRLALVSGLLVLPQVGITSLLLVCLVDHRGVSMAPAAAVLTCAQALGAASRLAVGLWSDTVGSRLRPLRYIAAGTVPLAALVGAVVEAPIPILVGALLLFCVTAVSWNGLAFGAAGEMSAPDRAATAMGLQNTAIFGGGALAPPFVAMVADTVNWPAAFLVLAVPAALAAILLTPLTRRPIRTPEAHPQSPARLITFGADPVTTGRAAA